MYTTAPEASAEIATRPRDNERRALLLQTTLELIAERGIDGVTHRSVADAAGVSLGSTTYWFASRQQMLTEALEQFARHELELLHDHLDVVLDGRLSLDRLVDQLADLLLPQLEEQRWRTVAQYTLLTEAGRRPELEPVCREWTNAWTSALTELFESLGAADPQLEARMFLAMLDGLLLGQLAAPDEDFESAVLRPALHRWFDRAAKETR